MAREFTNDKVVGEMTRDGLQMHNLNTGEVERTSQRIKERSFSRSEPPVAAAFRSRNPGNGGGNPPSDPGKGGGKRKHSYLQRRYNKKFYRNLARRKKDIRYQERYGKKLQRKEAHMHKKVHLQFERVRKIDYAAYGKLGRPKDYTGEEHYKYGRRLQRTPKLYRTRDLAVTRAVRNGGKVFFNRVESAYFADDETNHAQRLFHDGYRAGKKGVRYGYHKLSHPVSKLKNRSYQKTKDKKARADNHERRHNRLTEKYRFKLAMETSWRRELQASEAAGKLNAREKLKKKIQYKHAYKKKYEQTFAQKTKQNFQKAVKKTKQRIVRQAKRIILACGVGLLIGLLFYMLTSCAAMVATFGTEGAVNMMAGLFVTGFDEITDCDTYFSKLLNDLQNNILTIEEDHPGYDEYQYWVNGNKVTDAEAMTAYIVYNQIELASYLSTQIPEYTLETATPLMDALFAKMFVIEQEEIVEERERQAHDDEGNPAVDAAGNAVNETYECHILKTSLTSKTIAEIMEEELTEDEYSQWDTFRRSEGNLKIYGSPFAFEWHPYISSYFGYRNHPIDGVAKQHKGIDIAVPAGTKIYSIMEGTVTTSAYSQSAGNWIVIVDKDGYVSKYMHCSTLLVGAGTQVKRGQLIATVGSTGNSTGNHLHLQIEDQNGKYINPLYICAEYGEEVAEQDE